MWHVILWLATFVWTLSTLSRRRDTDRIEEIADAHLGLQRERERPRRSALYARGPPRPSSGTSTIRYIVYIYLSLSRCQPTSPTKTYFIYYDCDHRLCINILFLRFHLLLTCIIIIFFFILYVRRAENMGAKKNLCVFFFFFLTRILVMRWGWVRCVCLTYWCAWPLVNPLYVYIQPKSESLMRVSGKIRCEFFKKKPQGLCYTPFWMPHHAAHEALCIHLRVHLYTYMQAPRAARCCTSLYIYTPHLGGDNHRNFFWQSSNTHTHTTTSKA